MIKFILTILAATTLTASAQYPRTIMHDISKHVVAPTNFWQAQTNDAAFSNAVSAVTPVAVGSGKSVAAGSNVSAVTNGQLVTVSADVSHAEVSSATDGLSGVLTSRITNATNDLSGVLRAYSDTGPNDSATRTTAATNDLSGVLVTRISNSTNDVATRTTAATNDLSGVLATRITAATNDLSGVLVTRITAATNDLNSTLVTRISNSTNDVATRTTAATNDLNTVLRAALVPQSRTVSATSPLSGGGALSGNLTLTIADAAADGSTKGAATFTASDFNVSGGVVSLDYVNGQAASASLNGFLSSTDWATFNGKQAAGSYAAQSTTITIAGTSGQIISSAGAQDLSANRTATLSLDSTVTNIARIATPGTIVTNGASTVITLSNNLTVAKLLGSTAAVPTLTVNASALVASSSIRGNENWFELHFVLGAATQQANSNYFTITFPDSFSANALVCVAGPMGTNSSGGTTSTKFTFRTDGDASGNTRVQVYTGPGAPTSSFDYGYGVFVGRF